VTDFHHVPVMAERIVEAFLPVPSGWVVDATVGGGGHSRLLLEARPDLSVLGIDRDPAALAAAAAVLGPYGDRVVLRRARFDALATVMSELPIPDHPAFGPDFGAVSGVLFDLGVSSPQLDRAERGFSYRSAGPLDMRMDPDQEWTAGDVVNGYEESELAHVLATHGDERFARRIARAIVAARPIETTAELAAIVRDAIPAPARRRGGHPAKRTFQAIRIEVNGELDQLPGAIDAAVAATRPGGRVAVLAYHSGEDRIVKARFLDHANGGCTCPPGLPCVCEAVRTVRLVKKGTWKPSAAEIAANPRAESARLRVVERLDTDAEPGSARDQETNR
jgi:16S rRNA (cytosine1402-N4)-methyltransferase